MLQTTLPECDDGPFRRVFKALLPFEKEEKKKVLAWTNIYVAYSFLIELLSTM